MNHNVPQALITVERFWLGLILFLMIAGILTIERLLDAPSSAFLIMVAMVAYGLVIGLANAQQRRRLAKLPPIEETAAETYEWPYVSVVIPAHDEGVVIADTVVNMLALDYPTFELWVIDDRSRDNTRQVLDALQAKLDDRRLHVVSRPENAIPGKSAVLNDALELVKGDLILVMDADGRVDADFLKQLVPVMRDEQVAAVQARKVIANHRANPLTRCQAIEYMMDAQVQDGRDTIRGAVELRGNGQLVKREALESVDGWTDESITDDLDLSTKLHLAGWDIRFMPNVTTHEQGVIKFYNLLRQRRRWAEGSLKRYLAYGLNIVASSRISKRAQLDMILYFLQFIFPLWLFFDLLMQGGEWAVLGAAQHWRSSLMVLPVFGLFLWGTNFVSMLRFDKDTHWPKAVGESLLTTLFLIVVWIPVVLWITFKVMFRPDQGATNWGKTPRTEVYLAQMRE
ncbi:MAG: glycosyltransferase family 2 protein [Cyanobacteria bacterium HKST-UBA06]|nr:glycosyltransferase family 2 protein [Cyanobacteria bacterium HKST-UBA06]